MCSTPILHGQYTIQCPYSSGLLYPDLHGPPWTTSSRGGDTIFKLDQKRMMTAELILGVVGGEAVTHGVFHT